MAVCRRGPLEAVGGQGVSGCRHHLARSVGPPLWVCFLSCQESGIGTPKEHGRKGYVIPETRQELEVLALEEKYYQEMKPKENKQFVFLQLLTGSAAYTVVWCAEGFVFSDGRQDHLKTLLRYCFVSLHVLQ